MEMSLQLTAALVSPSASWSTGTLWGSRSMSLPDVRWSRAVCAFGACVLLSSIVVAVLSTDYTLQGGGRRCYGLRIITVREKSI